MRMVSSSGREIARDVNGLTSSLILASSRLAKHEDRSVAIEARRLNEVANRIREICQAELLEELAHEPHSLDCLVLMIADVDLAISPNRSEVGRPYSIHLQTEGDISFDCSAPVLFRILYNLIANAAAALEYVHAARIDVFATQHDGRLYVQIADNGHGLDQDVRDWFAAGSNSGARDDRVVGTGLVSVAKLLDRSGGSLKLIYSGDEGTRIGLCLPVMPDHRLRSLSAFHLAT